MAAETVIVALSGGVDSAVAALRLRDSGFAVECLHMTNWEDDGYCDAAKELEDARRVCSQLGLPLHRVNFAREYREQVFSRFLEESRRGRTPNPDVLCNREIKFGVMRRYARRLGGRRLATGHYARVDVDAGMPRLFKGLDGAKDQSYFLHAVEADDLADVIFPIGDLRKAQVRELARRARLDVAEKKDSTGICFIGERPFADFLRRYVAAEPGPIRDSEGRLLGEHRGLAFYTLGQRHGLGVGGVAARAEAPWYVAAKDVERNELVVVQGHDHPLLYADALRATDVHWIGEAPRAWPAGAPLRCAAKTRYRQPDQPCTIVAAGPAEADVVFDVPQRAVTPGQYVVFYDGDRCLGGGTIDAAERRGDFSGLAAAERAAG
ncbi:MAG TPA: tRNA 2-thiouridine(34) synthase MnmA [Gammaproteobacteria bacterium]|nr:tRNA 2-thiouridine(34) synthase MnmA [Gammaproteobacteria bacterium]